MAIKLTDNLRVNQQKPVDDKYFNGLVPYISTSQVNTLIPKAVRHIGLTVNINREEYWYKDGIEDSNLVLKITNNSAYDLKNQEQDNRLENLEGIYYVWSPTNRTLTLYDRKGTQLSQVSLVSLDNEGTDLRYNATTLSLELYNADNELLDSIPVSSFIGSVGTKLQLNSNELQLKDSQGNILSTVTFAVSNIDGLQTVLNNKLDKGTYTGNASDLKSLIDTKADLVGGKVPKAQSQPSTMVMDSSTYVITFTDATGAVQTIDLPLESLFKDANYNSSTKSLIVTLQDGTTRTIPLTDLVDLPEIVLSTSNPAVTPTTGQKVYFNTSLGKVWFNVGGTWSGGYSLINTITSNVTSTTTVGAINAGDIIPAGTTIQELAELIFNKTFYPTFVNPTFGLTNNAGIREVGSSFNVTLTFNFNRGQILGKLVGGIWNPTMLQDYRAGTATSYLLNGVSGSNNSASFNVTTILGNNNLSGSVTYGIGVQPKDSKNNNYDNPLPSGTSPIQSTSFEGIYPYFYYKSTSPITPAIMQSAIANNQATKVLASSTGTITVDFDANGEYIAVAYPEISTTKTIWYVNALDNGEIPGGLLGGVNTLPCNSPTNLWNNVNFKIHVSAGLITQPNPIQLKNS